MKGLATTEAIPAQNQEAEEYVLGAMMLSEKAIDDVAPVLGDGSAFYRTSHMRIYQAALALHGEGNPVDVVTLAAELERQGRIEEIGGVTRIKELGKIVPAVSNAVHYARLVREAANRRQLLTEVKGLLTICEDGGLERTEAKASLERIGVLLDSADGERTLEGLSYARACEAEIPETRELIEGVVDAGTVGLIAGLPFARKSFLAQQLAHVVAAGDGLLLGRYPVVSGGPVIYVWQDDSTAKELERIQAYAARHNYSPSLPLRFLLNEGVCLPDDLPALRRLVVADEAVLVILDSLYNVVSPEAGSLKDEAIGAVLASIKRDLCDATGVTVGVVDHSPWPSEGNRGQRRAYGSVFKTAAVRWSIHLEADGKDASRLHVEARGNNVAGFRRCPAIWDEETYEIHLLEPQLSAAAQVRALLEESEEGLTISELTEATGKADKTIREILKKLPAKKLARIGSTGENRWVLPLDETDEAEDNEDGRLWRESE